MRKTLFIHTKKILPIAYSATRKIIEQYYGRFLENYEISEKEYQIYTEQILNILNENELPTSEIKKRLDDYKKTSQLLGLMCDQGILIRGTPVKGWKDRRNNYTLFQNYFPDINLKKYNETDALNVLLNKYLTTYGPSTENDISWWCGTGKRKVRETLDNFKEDIEIVNIKGIKHEYLIFKPDIKFIENISPFKEKLLVFLPMLDPYIMGYKDRERYIDKKHYDYAFDRSGNATSTILLNGTIIGVWESIEKPDSMIKVFIFEEVDEEVKKLIKIRVSELGKFIHEKDVKLKECDKMEPLTNRTAGNFITPLKNC